jgi:uncharacterized protein YybS (DUF2232 family)
VGDKQAWLLTRTFVGIASYMLATFVSLAVLVEFSDAARFERGLLAGVLYLIAVTAISLSLVVGLMSYVLAKRFYRNRGDEIPYLWRWYFLTLPISVVLYLLLIFIV